MEAFYYIDGFQVKIDREQVMHAIDCMPDNPVYEDMVEEYQEIYPEILQLVKPLGIIGFGSLSQQSATAEFPAGSRVLYAVISVGDGISQSSTRAFQEGDYVRGMLYDAMADVALFSLESRMQEKLREICAKHRVGILKRLEAPQDISMEVQREAWECLRLKERLGMDISSGYMLDPVKSTCQVFVLTEDVNTFRAQHDCRNCSNVNCKYRSK